jgi:hypothetical protein
VDHRVDQLGVAHAGAEARRGQQVGGAAHRLHAAGDQQPRLAELDVLGGGGDRVQSGKADLVDGERGHGHRDGGPDRRLPGGDLALPGLQHVAEDDVLDRLGSHPGPLHGGGRRQAAKLDGRQGREGASEAADRRACARADHGFGSLEHALSPFECARSSLPPGVGCPS